MSDFTLTTHWLVAATIEEVAAILAEPERLPDWWPEVYLSVEVLDPGDADGLGRIVAFHTRGWLPYTLRWQGRWSRRTARTAGPSRRPATSPAAASGGSSSAATSPPSATTGGSWSKSRGLKPLTPLLQPLYAANHRWAMARGLEGLHAELARRRALARVA